MKKKGNEERAAKGKRVKAEPKPTSRTNKEANPAATQLTQKTGKKTLGKDEKVAEDKTAKKLALVKKKLEPAKRKARGKNKTAKTKGKSLKTVPQKVRKGKVMKTKAKLEPEKSRARGGKAKPQKRDELSIIARRIQESKHIKPSKRFTEPLVYVCKRCKQTVQLYIPAKVVCSRCGRPMQIPEADPALPELANAA